MLTAADLSEAGLWPGGSSSSYFIVTLTMTLIRATRAEPDPALFQIPEGYHAMTPDQQAAPDSGTSDSGTQDSGK